MATQAQYASVPKYGIGQVSTANTNRDGTGTLATVFTAGTNGSRIDAINLKAVGTTTAGMIRLFIHDGSNARLLTEVPVTALAFVGSAAEHEQHEPSAAHHPADRLQPACFHQQR